MPADFHLPKCQDVRCGARLAVKPRAGLPREGERTPCNNFFASVFCLCGSHILNTQNRKDT